MYRTALAGAYPLRSSSSANASMCGPLIPPLNRRSVLGAEKYFSNMVSPYVIGGDAQVTVAGGHFYGELMRPKRCSKCPIDHPLARYTLHHELLPIMHELYETASCPHFEHASACPPSAAVRQHRIACSTFRCSQENHFGRRSKKLSPVVRITSATSTGGRGIYLVLCGSRLDRKSTRL